MSKTRVFFSNNLQNIRDLLSARISIKIVTIKVFHLRNYFTH